MTKTHGDAFHPSLGRRGFLTLLGGAALTGATCSWTPWSGVIPSTAAASDGVPRAGEFGELVATDPGGIDLHIERQRMRIGGGVGRAITINGSVPGPVIRMKQGKQAVIRVHNHMDEMTSIHWHGILLPFDMDGVPGISFAGIGPGETFVYRFPVRQNGTYWYHSHAGLQEQLGHYGQLIVEPENDDPVDYDVEHTVVLSDWTFEEPHDVLAKLKTMEGYYNFQRPTLANIDDQMRVTGKSFGEVVGKRLSWDGMRMDPTDIADITGATYSYLMNGRTASENSFFRARPGERVRLRIANASTMTFYDVRVPGLPMTVVQADGQNVRPVETDELRIGVAETYDVLVQLPDDRPRTLFAETMDRSGFTRGTLAPHEGAEGPVPERRPRPMLTMADMGMMVHASGVTRDGDRPEGDELPTEDLPESVAHGPDGHGPASITMARNAYRRLDHPGVGLGDDGWRVLTYGQLRARERPPLRRAPTRQIDLHLTGNMHKYVWGFDGKKWSESDLIRFEYGERLRINMINDTMMSHPIHLHGMWMDLYAGGDLDSNPRKHTVIVQPAELLTVDITADAPGQWAFHCHLLYHMEAGMFRTVAVVKSLEGGPIRADA